MMIRPTTERFLVRGGADRVFLGMRKCILLSNIKNNLNAQLRPTLIFKILLHELNFVSLHRLSPKREVSQVSWLSSCDRLRHNKNFRILSAVWSVERYDNKLLKFNYPGCFSASLKKNVIHNKGDLQG